MILWQPLCLPLQKIVLIRVTHHANKGIQMPAMTQSVSKIRVALFYLRWVAGFRVKWWYRSLTRDERFPMEVPFYFLSDKIMFYLLKLHAKFVTTCPVLFLYLQTQVWTDGWNTGFKPSVSALSSTRQHPPIPQPHLWTSDHLWFGWKLDSISLCCFTSLLSPTWCLQSSHIPHACMHSHHCGQQPQH